MKCREVLTWLLLSRPTTALPDAIQRHTHRCPRCQTWWQRLQQLDQETAALPDVEANAPARARFLEEFHEVAGHEGPVTLPLPAPKPRRHWGAWVAAHAALIMLGISVGYLVFASLGKRPEEAVAVKPKGMDDRLLDRLVSVNLELAQAYEPDHQLYCLNQMAADLRAEAIRLAREGAPDDLPLLSTIHERVLQRGVVGRFQAVPPAQQPQMRTSLAHLLQQGRDELNQALKDMPPDLADFLRPMSAATEATSQALNKPKPSPAKDAVLASAGTGTTQDLVSFLANQSVLLAEEADPLRRAYFCHDLADRFSLALAVASSRSDAERAVKLGKQLDKIMDQGVAANLGRVESTDPRWTELDSGMDRVHQMVVIIHSSPDLAASQPGQVPYGQVKNLQEAMRDLKNCLGDLSRDPLPAGRLEPRKEIKGVVKSFDAGNGRMVLQVKDRGREFEMRLAVPADVRLFAPGGRQRTPADLMPGARIRVKLRDSNTVAELRVD